VQPSGDEMNCEMRDRIRAGLRNVIPGNRHRIEIMHLVMPPRQYLHAPII